MDLQKKNLENLFKLIKENPGLPVVPMVFYEVVGDDDGYWIGRFGHSYVGEYTLFEERYYEDREDFKEAYYCAYDEELDAKFSYNPNINPVTVEIGRYTEEELERNSKQEKMLEEYLDGIADKCFRQAIIVNICTPEDGWFGFTE